MTTEYLESKWRLWWKSLDVNHDGYLSEDDLEDTERNYFNLTHLEGERAEQVEKVIATWWRTYIFRGRKGKITADQFVESLARDFAADSAKFRANMEHGFYDIFDVFDMNRDHYISEEELLLVFQSYGHHNLAPEKELFKKMEPVAGKVPLSKVIAAMIVFTCCPDESERDVVKEALEAGA